MNEFRTVYSKLSPIDRHAVLMRARKLYLRRHPKLIPLLATLAAGFILPVLAVF